MFPAETRAGHGARRMDGLTPIVVRAHGTAGGTVVLLHGGPGGPGSVTDLAVALSGEFRVIEPLQRRSGAVPLTVERHVADLAVVAPNPATLVGWSWGAMLALSFAARHPARVRALALVGCGTYDEVSRASYERALGERLGAVGRARLAALRARLDHEGDARQRVRLFGEVAALTGAAQACDPLEPGGPTPEAGEPSLELDPRGFDETWTDALRLQAEGIEPDAFAAIRVPVLMLHGDVDPHPGPATRDRLRRLMPQLEYVQLGECGHAPWRERRARGAFLAALGGWLRNVM